MKKFAVCLSVFLLALFLLSISAHAITNGQPDGYDHPYVGAVNNGLLFCSGVAISSNVFVTAAHCFFYSGEPVRVTFHPEPFSSDSRPEYHAGTWYPHPDFCPGCGPGVPGFDTHDVAVVVFDQPVWLPDYAELPELGLVDTLDMGTEVTVVGYGAQDFRVGGGPPEPDFFYARYFAPTKLFASNHKHSNEYIKLTVNPAQGKGGLCFGDSGGPNLLGNTNTILAVISYGANIMRPGIGYSNRIDTQYALEFINSFLD